MVFGEENISPAEYAVASEGALSLAALYAKSAAPRCLVRRNILSPLSGWRRRGARREKRTLFWSIAAMGSSAPTGPATQEGQSRKLRPPLNFNPLKRFPSLNDFKQGEMKILRLRHGQENRMIEGLGSQTQKPHAFFSFSGGLSKN